MPEKEFENLKKKIGKNIKVRRLGKNLSQKELGFISGLDLNYIGGIERGERNMTIKNLFLIASSLNTTIDSLLL